MKRIFASIGLVAVGASSLHADNAAGLTAGERTKLVTVSGALRGFYDDNFTTQVSGSKLSAWGIEASPAISLNKVTASTLFRADALYDIKHYAATPSVNDQSVQVSGLVDHKFTETQKLKLKDSFVLAQEPEVLDPVAKSTPLRTKGSNIRNTGSADYVGDLNNLLQLEVTYDGTVYHYNDKSFQPLLDRLEQLGGLDLRFKFTKETTGVLGYNFGDVSYSDKFLNDNSGNPTTTEANIRNNRSHFALAGFDTKLSPTLKASVRVGAQFFDYYNFHKTQTSPYADGSLEYNYMQGAYLQVGVKHLHNATDITGNDVVNHPVLDTEATVAYAQLTQPLSFISPDLTASIYGSFQHSDFNGDQASGLHDASEDYYTASGNLAYKFTPNFSAEAGYNYDQVTSTLRPFTRNRVYFGLRATY